MHASYTFRNSKDLLQRRRSVVLNLCRSHLLPGSIYEKATSYDNHSTCMAMAGRVA